MSLALIWRFAGPFLKAYGKPIGIAIAIGGAWWGFTVWRDARDASFERKGFAAAEAQYKTAVEAANKVAAGDTQNMGMIQTLVGALVDKRSQAIDLTVKPVLEGARNEVANDPRYRDCRVSDGMLANANSVRAAVDASIGAGNAEANRSGSAAPGAAR